MSLLNKLTTYSPAIKRNNNRKNTRGRKTQYIYERSERWDFQPKARNRHIKTIKHLP
jgi:hypothetical protein